ncbi:MAG: hypothetical protein ACI4XM_04515 [Candidatus Coprovivens sp.]
MNNNVIRPSRSNEVLEENGNNGVTIPKDVMPKKRKSNVFLIVLLFLILIGIIGFGGWNLYLMHAKNDNTLEKDNQSKENLDLKDNLDENKELLPPVKNDKYTFYKEVNKEAVLNGHKVPLIFYYYLDKESYVEADFDDNDSKDYYVLRREVFLAGNKSIDISIVSVFTDSSVIDNYFNDNLYVSKTFKSEDEKDEYLVLFLGNNNDIISDNNIFNHRNTYENIAYILNSDGVVLKEIINQLSYFSLQGIYVDKEYTLKMNYTKAVETTIDDDVTGETKTSYMIYTDSYLDIGDNYIYYVVGSCDIFTEFKLSINNGKLKEEIINTYSEDMWVGAGGC